MNAPLIQITKSGVACSLTAREQTRMRTVFDRTHCLRFPKLLEPALLHPIQTRIEKAGFYEKDYRKVTNLTVRYLNRLNDKVVDNMLNFLLNNEQLFRLIRETTGCLGISGFAGRVYRMSPHTGHYDSWHDDLRDHRLIAMSMNLSTEVYSGWILQIRDTRSGHIVHEAANTGFGDAVLFRLAPFLEHRVTGVEGTASRTAFSGWFRSQPHYQPIVNPSEEKSFSSEFEKEKVPGQASGFKKFNVCHAKRSSLSPDEWRAPCL